MDRIFVGLENIDMKSPRRAPPKSVKPRVINVKPLIPVDDAPVNDDDEFPKKKKLPSPFTHHLPPERTWTTAATHEKSPVFLTWLAECQAIVDAHFGAKTWNLVVKVITNYLWITLQSKHEIRVFAFIAKASGNIHCPALFDEPFTSCHGNIADSITRLSIMTPWGVTTPWSWLPTFPDSKRYCKVR